MPDANTAFREALALTTNGDAPASKGLFRAFEAALIKANSLAVGEQIIDATVVSTPEQRNTDGTLQPRKRRERGCLEGSNFMTSHSLAHYSLYQPALELGNRANWRFAIMAECGRLHSISINQHLLLIYIVLFAPACTMIMRIHRLTVSAELFLSSLRSTMEFSMTDIPPSDAAPPPPAIVRDLGPPNAVHLFASMHRTTALRGQQVGALVSTREELGNPDHICLGDPTLVRQRLNVRMQAPWLGCVADYVPLTFTPKTAAALGSCGPKPAPGATRLRATDLVVAVVPLEALTSSGLTHGFADRNPIRGAEISQTLDVEGIPWQLIRAAKFGGADIDPVERAKYYREALVWSALPIQLGVIFCVADEATAQEFYLEASRSGRPTTLPLVRPGFFFGL